MNTDEILKMIIDNIREIIPELNSVNEVITRGDMLSPLGMDSVGRATLIEKTLEDLNLNVSRFEFNTATNLGELADLFYERTRSKQS
jgi:polyketide biosynthesis acyl carrier protein